MIVLAKALSGGLVPVGAVLMSDEVYDSVYTSFKRAIVHTSTFSENALAMRAGLATLDALEEERLGERAERVGDHLRRELVRRLSAYPDGRGSTRIGTALGDRIPPAARAATSAVFRCIRENPSGDVRTSVGDAALRRSPDLLPDLRQ